MIWILTAIVIVVLYYMVGYVFNDKIRVGEFYRNIMSRECVYITNIKNGIVVYKNLNGIEKTMSYDMFKKAFEEDYE